MSNLPGNPYLSRGQETLALAYEQRTANLIAYIETFGGGIDYDDIWHDVSTRLGLGENDA